ncbi:MAG: hypothetical protein OXI60_04320 [Acidiferrobacterales bacterium]|nr:hypothetical protein [Acidiferrobacterales bacterium]
METNTGKILRRGYDRDHDSMSKNRANVETKLHLAFVIDDMEGGGAEAFVLNLIESLLAKCYKIDLVLFYYRGFRLSQIPDGVNLIVLDRHFNPNVSPSSKLAENIHQVQGPTGFWKISKAWFGYFRALHIEKND